MFIIFINYKLRKITVVFPLQFIELKYFSVHFLAFTISNGYKYVNMMKTMILLPDNYFLIESPNSLKDTGL